MTRQLLKDHTLTVNHIKINQMIDRTKIQFITWNKPQTNILLLASKTINIRNFVKERDIIDSATYIYLKAAYRKNTYNSMILED
jgi:hypothetical protein